MEDLVPLLDRTGPGGSGDRGRKLFRDIGCIQCHPTSVAPSLDL
jgi:CxxC motif-containing protein (DUF1111 family)